MALKKQNSIFLYNSLSKEKEVFKSIKHNVVSMYTCGPTVYDTPHIGNYRSYIFSDILKRTLIFNGYQVKHVVNITDVGHLTDDEDSGEDKLEKRAVEENKKAKEIAETYTNQFLLESKMLNILEANENPKATEHIDEQVKIIKNLEKKKFTYKISDGIYFDTEKLENYGVLTNKKDTDQKGRIEENKEKRNPYDFALWKFSKDNITRQMEWDSPWGKGFPGWHIECSAMSYKYLSFPFDIHTGGIDHKPIHHENEIAQNETFFGNKTVNYWLHNDFIVVDGKKMSKSLQNLYTLSDLKEKGFSPLALRYLYLTTHYRQVLGFSWNSLTQAQEAYDNLLEHVQRVSNSKKSVHRFVLSFFTNRSIKKHWINKFKKAINDDLNTAQALATLWELLKNENIHNQVKLEIVLIFDTILGLNISSNIIKKIPDEIQVLAKDREEYRAQKNWAKSDELRDEIAKRGYIIEDTESKFRILKK